MKDDGEEKRRLKKVERQKQREYSHSLHAHTQHISRMQKEMRVNGTGTLQTWNNMKSGSSSNSGIANNNDGNEDAGDVDWNDDDVDDTQTYTHTHTDTQRTEDTSTHCVHNNNIMKQNKFVKMFEAFRGISFRKIVICFNNHNVICANFSSHLTHLAQIKIKYYVFNCSTVQLFIWFTNRRIVLLLSLPDMPHCLSLLLLLLLCSRMNYVSDIHLRATS